MKSHCCWGTRLSDIEHAKICLLGVCMRRARAFNSHFHSEKFCEKFFRGRSGESVNLITWSLTFAFEWEERKWEFSWRARPPPTRARSTEFSLSMAIFIFVNVEARRKSAEWKTEKRTFIYSQSFLYLFFLTVFHTGGKITRQVLSRAGWTVCSSSWRRAVLWRKRKKNEKAKRTAFRHSSTRHKLLCRPLMQRCFLWSIFFSPLKNTKLFFLRI